MNPGLIEIYWYMKEIYKDQTALQSLVSLSKKEPSYQGQSYLGCFRKETNQTLLYLAAVGRMSFIYGLAESALEHMQFPKHRPGTGNLLDSLCAALQALFISWLVYRPLKSKIPPAQKSWAKL